MSCLASRFVFVILGVGGPARFPFFLSDFIDNTQNPSVADPCFNGFTILSLENFVDGDRDELLFCPIKVLRKYLSRTEQYRSGIKGHFDFTGVRKKRVSQNTISSWLRSVISLRIRRSSRRTVESCGSGFIKLGMLLLPCCSGRTAQSIRY